MRDRMTSYATSGTRIFVAEDDDELRGVVVEALQADGYTVVEARDGAELLALLETTLDDPSASPAVIVADVRMPKLSGLGVLDHLRKANIHVPVVMMTGFAIESVGVVARRLGALGVLGKPFDVDDLRMAVMNANRSS